MDIHYNADLEVQFHLNKIETNELEETGYCETEDGYCFTMNDGQISVYKRDTDWRDIKLTY